MAWVWGGPDAQGMGTSLGVLILDQCGSGHVGVEICQDLDLILKVDVFYFV